MQREAVKRREDEKLEHGATETASREAALRLVQRSPVPISSRGKVINVAAATVGGAAFVREF